jgi:hypothetical protein
MRRRDSSSEGRRRASTFFRRGAKAVARVMTTEHEICSVAQQAHGRRRACVHPSDVPPIDAAESRRAPRAYRILYAPTRVRNERRSRTRGPETGGAVSRGWHTCKKAKKTEGAELSRKCVQRARSANAGRHARGADGPVARPGGTRARDTGHRRWGVSMESSKVRRGRVRKESEYGIVKHEACAVHRTHIM